MKKNLSANAMHVFLASFYKLFRDIHPLRLHQISLIPIQNEKFSNHPLTINHVYPTISDQNSALECTTKVITDLERLFKQFKIFK